jgi:hypothetical protein
MRRKRVTVFDAICLLPVAIAVGIWVFSYSRTYPAVDPQTGLAAAPPQLLIPFPVPSDATEYLAFAHGRLERWEYTSWDRRWYRYGSGMPLWIPTLAILVLALALIVASRIKLLPE